MKKLIATFHHNRFLFEELVKRDFKQRYKRTALGMAWSLLNPLLTLLVMRLVFTRFFGRDKLYYSTYLFAGNLLFTYFRESTTGGMNALMQNSTIITKINVPKYLFLLTKNVSAVINFGLTLVVFFLFVAIDRVPFSWSFLAVIYPIITLTIFNLGMGMILSALYVFFRDIQYLYGIFTRLLMYMSAIFYYVDSYPAKMQRVFLLNPVYCNIKYLRIIILEGQLPSLQFHALMLFYGLAAMAVGGLIYKNYSQKFLYYM